MTKTSLTLAAVALLLAGCSVGDAPKPLEANEVKAALDKATPQQQIDWINGSPLPAAEKQRRIQEIETKTGYKAPAQKGPQAPK